MPALLLTTLLTLFPVSAQAPALPPPLAAEARLKFRIPEHDLFPESIAYDPVTKRFFLSSMAQSRILTIGEDGAVEEFVASDESGLLSSIGMKVDARRRVLWVCTGRFSLYAAADVAPARTGLLEFSLEDGELRRSFLGEQPSRYHIFNDLAIDAKGRVYATTTLLGSIHAVDATSDVMELFHKLPDGSHDNGITVGLEGRFLFVVVDRSVDRIDLETRERITLAFPAGEGLGVDGLYAHRDTLIGVVPRQNRIVRYHLNDARDVVVRVEDLLRDHPEFVYPTTGVVVGDSFVVVATSYADRERRDELEEQHPDVLIYELDL